MHKHPIFQTFLIVIIGAIIFLGIAVSFSVFGDDISLVKDDKGNGNASTTISKHIEIPLRFSCENSLTSGVLEDSLESDFKSPDLYPEFSWNSVLRSSSFTLNSVSYESADFPRGRDIVGLCGKMWEVSIHTISLLQSRDIQYAVLNYFDAWAIGHGWDETVEKRDMVITAPAISGDSGGIRGYVKISDDLFRVLTVGYSLVGIPPQNPYQKVENNTECPCTLSLAIFVSDPVTFQKLQK